jgi:DNA-binding beta-propeller fold protein YncE
MRIAYLILAAALCLLLAPHLLADTFYLGDVTDNRIVEMSAAGALTTYLTNISDPSGMAFDSGGNLFVACESGGFIYEIKPDKNVSIPFDNSLLANGIGGLAFDGNGNLFAAIQGKGKPGDIVEITPTGSTSIFASGLPNPQGLAFDASGNLYVTTFQNNTILKITPSGSVSTFATGLDVPLGLAFDMSGNLYAANQFNSMISKISPSGNVATFASVPSGVFSLAFDSARNLFTGDFLAMSEISPGGNVGIVTPMNFDSFYIADPSVTLPTNVPEPGSTGIFAIFLGALAIWRNRNPVQAV